MLHHDITLDNLIDVKDLANVGAVNSVTYINRRRVVLKGERRGEAGKLIVRHPVLRREALFRRVLAEDFLDTLRVDNSVQKAAHGLCVWMHRLLDVVQVSGLCGLLEGSQGLLGLMGSRDVVRRGLCLHPHLGFFLLHDTCDCWAGERSARGKEREAATHISTNSIETQLYDFSSLCLFHVPVHSKWSMPHGRDSYQIRKEFSI